MRQADHLLGNNIESSFPFDSSTAEQYLDDMFDHYQAETVESAWTTKFPTYAEVAWEVEHIMESRRELDLPAWSREEAEAFLKEKQSAIRSIVWDAGEVYIRDMMRSEHQCPECERDLNPDATRCHNCNPYEEVNQMKEFDKLEYIRTILEQLSEEIWRHIDEHVLLIDNKTVNQAIKYIDDLKFESEV